MHKVMGDSYSKSVERIGMDSGISSLLRHSQNNLTMWGWLQISGYALFVRCLWTNASTVLNGCLTSLKNYLYPISTVPIVITMNFNKLIIVRSV
jgi:hypothetical protein